MSPNVLASESTYKTDPDDSDAPEDPLAKHRALAMVSTLSIVPGDIDARVNVEDDAVSVMEGQVFNVADSRARPRWSRRRALCAAGAFGASCE